MACEPKVYDEELTRSMMHHICHLWPISSGYADLILTSLQVMYGGIPCVPKLIYEIVNARNEIFVFDGNFIECLIFCA